MRPYKKEILKLETKKVLCFFLDNISEKLVMPFLLPNKSYKKSIKEFKKLQEIDQYYFAQRIKYLKRMGYINEFVKNKKRYFELKTRGISKLNKILAEDLIIQKPRKWDRKWRIVLFDIPERLRSSRQFIQWKLCDLGFIQIQKSVYAYPFSCTREIHYLTKIYQVEKYVLIMIAEIIQGEAEIIAKLVKKGILNKKYILDTYFVDRLKMYPNLRNATKCGKINI